MSITPVLMLTAAIASPQGSDKHATVRVYLYAAPPAAAQATPEETGRLAAVRDMRDALQRKKGIALVDDRGQANVIIEVVNREQREEPMGGFGGKSVTRMGDTIIRLHISAGEAEADLKGIGQGTWGRAAKDAADRVVKWIARREPSKLLPRQTALATTRSG